MSTRAIPYLFVARSRQPGDPPYDPSLPIKAWADPSPASDPVTYNVFDPNHNVVKLTMPKAQAEVVNFPGHDLYPPYVAVAAAATFNGGNFPFGVVSRAEAESLATALGVGTGAISDAMDGFKGMFSIDYGTETRRAWTILFKGTTVLAAFLVGLQNANGVGAPGAWDLTGQSPVWVSHIAPTVAAPDAVILPVPLGPIDPAERVVNVGPMGAEQVLEMPDPPAAAATGTGGGYTDADRSNAARALSILEHMFGAVVPK